MTISCKLIPGCSSHSLLIFINIGASIQTFKYKIITLLKQFRWTKTKYVTASLVRQCPLYKTQHTSLISSCTLCFKGVGEKSPKQQTRNILPGWAQNHRTSWTGRDLQGSSSPTPRPVQHNPENVSFWSSTRTSWELILFPSSVL